MPGEPARPAAEFYPRRRGGGPAEPKGVRLRVATGERVRPSRCAAPQAAGAASA